ncbi:MAG: DUF542 domain-containing protein [Acidobacteriota bacterium]|nr:DUF542 domain-containing protein [Acidobacteriota bacterium]
MSTATQSIREIVTEHPSVASVFLRFDIDLCSQAETSLGTACAELQLSVDQVLEKIEDAVEQGTPTVDPANLPIARLIQHIVRIHHHHVRQVLPGLTEMAHRLAAKRGDRAPELHEIETLVETLRMEMLAHIQKEEQDLFPFISQMDQDSVIAYPASSECFHSVAQPISVMEQEHESVGSIFAALRSLTNGFEPPAWACVTHCALFAGLREFDTKLRQHFYLENDVLFPRSIQLESELKTRS